MKIFLIAAGIVALSATATFAQTGGGKGTPSENANCLAQERATRNSAGGDRNPADGDGMNFGQAQSAYIATLNEPYGQFLKDYKAKCNAEQAAD